jgi:hypothetical protein
MNRKFLALCFSALMFGITCMAQTIQPEIKEDFKPSTLNQPGKEYPQVNSQGYARFKIIAPQAQTVVVKSWLGWRQR